MPDPKQLPYLLNLLDDESKLVQQTVLKELRAFGPALRDELTRLPQEPSMKQQELLTQLLEASHHEHLRESWSTWFSAGNDYQQLESALILLSEFQEGLGSPKHLTAVLDDLAREYRTVHGQADPYHLAEFLFQEKSLKGTQADYYNPQNSNLIYVVEKKRGIPISLTSIYMLVGARLGLHIEGCNMPGHFLACFRSGEKKILVDCFNRGRIIQKEDMALLDISYSQSIKEIIEQETTAEVIIRRYLNNLMIAYRRKKQKTNSRLMKDLLKIQTAHFNSKPALTERDFTKLLEDPRFHVGQLVRHKQYHYRGVVVDFDFSFQADDDWYYSNETQPNKDQCWYHVLVDKSSRITYVAQSSLESDSMNRAVDHPLTAHFFAKFEKGRYVRNNQRWPKI